MFLRLYRPEVFQGSLRKKRYFEGWYFKHITCDPSRTFVFIPGISLAENDSHSFIQIMNGLTGETDYIRYPLDTFRWNYDKFEIRIGSSFFTNEQINLNIEKDNLKITGRIYYHNIIHYPKSIFSPGIMGWYSFVPFMECNHGIVSVNHSLSGEITINGSIIDLADGKGYIEKDWGSSFPEAWIWIQSNNFRESDASFSFSIAKIPWLGKYFIGFICFLYLRKKFYLFSTYNKSTASIIHDATGTLEIIVRNHKNTLKARVIKNSFKDLKAPVMGEMVRRITESTDSEIHLQLFDNSGNLQYEDTGKNVGLEIIEKIFEYL